MFDTMRSPVGTNIQCYHLSHELRRAARWAVGGCLLMAPVGWWQFVFVQGRNRFDQTMVVLIFLCGAMWFAQYLWPQLRVDTRGISRRLLWGWDLWSWEEFESGHVRQGVIARSYKNPDRPWWRRQLQLGFLDDSDSESIDRLIHQVWTPYPDDRNATSVEFRINRPDRRVVCMSTQGITIRRHNTETAWRWGDVSLVEVWRVEPGRADFRDLRLSLPGQSLKLRQFINQGQECMTWRGASAEAIAAVIVRNVRASILRDFALDGAARSRAELDARQELGLRRNRESDQIQWWCLRLAWLVVLACPLVFPWPNAWFMSGCVALQVIAIHAIVHVSQRDSLRQMRAWEAQREALRVQENLADQSSD